MSSQITRALNLLKLQQEHHFMIWGLIDAFCIILYCIMELKQNHFPYVYGYEELLMFWRHTYTTAEWQYWGTRMLTAFWIFNLSIIVSCLLFFLNKKAVKYVVYTQAPFRLLFLVLLATLAYGSKTWVMQLGVGIVVLLIATIEFLRVRYLWTIDSPSFTATSPPTQQETK